MALDRIGSPLGADQRKTYQSSLPEHDRLKRERLES